MTCSFLLDNTPGHANEFVHENVTIKFFPPNVTSSRQPMDMGIIAALKKCYKYLLIKDVLVFNDLSPSIQNQQQQQGAAIHRGAAGDHYGKSATILDAANYILEA